MLINFRRGGHLVKSKVALLQSKRLYAREQEYEEDERIDYEIGFARLFRGSASAEAIMAPRVLAFGDASRYQSLKVGDGQYKAVDLYERQYGIPVYYMLYHPPEIPLTTEIPRVVASPSEYALKVGTRVIPSADIRAELASKSDGHIPTYEDLKALRPEPQAPSRSSPSWILEEFIADLAIDCKVGHLAEKESDWGLLEIFNRRSGPIAAALAVTFDASGQAAG